MSAFLAPIATTESEQGSLCEWHKDYSHHDTFLSTNHLVQVEYSDASSANLFVYKYNLPLSNEQSPDSIPSLLTEQALSQFVFFPLRDQPCCILKNFPLQLQNTSSHISTSPNTIPSSSPKHFQFIRHHPTSKYLVINTRRDKNLVQIFDYKSYLKTKDSSNYKLIIQNDFINSVRWIQWADDKTVLVLTSSSAYFWFMKKGSVPTLIGEFDSKLQKDHIITNVSLTPSRTSILICFRNKERSGLSQLFRLKDETPRVLKAHCGTFCNLRVRSKKAVSTLLTASKSSTNFILTREPLQEQGHVDKRQTLINLKYKEKDYPLGVFALENCGLAMVVTRLGLLALVDVHSLIQIYAVRISTVPLAHVLQLEQGFFAISVLGVCSTSFLHPDGILEFAARKLQTLLPGFEDVLLKRLEYLPPQNNTQQERQIIEQHKKMMRMKSMQSLNLLQYVQKENTSTPPQASPQRQESSNTKENRSATPADIETKKLLEEKRQIEEATRRERETLEKLQQEKELLLQAEEMKRMELDLLSEMVELGWKQSESRDHLQAEAERQRIEAQVNREQDRMIQEVQIRREKEESEQVTVEIADPTPQELSSATPPKLLITEQQSPPAVASLSMEHLRLLQEAEHRIIEENERLKKQLAQELEEKRLLEEKKRQEKEKRLQEEEKRLQEEERRLKQAQHQRDEEKRQLQQEAEALRRFETELRQKEVDALRMSMRKPLPKPRSTSMPVGSVTPPPTKKAFSRVDTFKSIKLSIPQLKNRVESDESTGTQQLSQESVRVKRFAHGGSMPMLLPRNPPLTTSLSANNIALSTDTMEPAFDQYLRRVKSISSQLQAKKIHPRTLPPLMLDASGSSMSDED